jgi:hypothetical protein
VENCELDELSINGAAVKKESQRIFDGYSEDDPLYWCLLDYPLVNIQKAIGNGHL